MSIFETTLFRSTYMSLDPHSTWRRTQSSKPSHWPFATRDHFVYERSLLSCFTEDLNIFDRLCFRRQLTRPSVSCTMLHSFAGIPSRLSTPTDPNCHNAPDSLRWNNGDFESHRKCLWQIVKFQTQTTRSLEKSFSTSKISSKNFHWSINNISYVSCRRRVLMRDL